MAAPLMIYRLLDLLLEAVFLHADAAIVGPVATAVAVVVLVSAAWAAVGIAVRAWK